ncbi:MAG TPA: MltA domain-containing protein [Roseiarcus sp.]|jgi:membrane-bound lytic murein transglycosylase A
MTPRLEPVGFEDLAGFARDDASDAFAAFLVSARALCEGVRPTRAAREASPRLLAVAREALALEGAGDAAARRFFVEHFQPFRVRSDVEGAGFLTGYYEPLVKGSLHPTADFTAPILARPADLVSFALGAAPAALDPTLAGAQRLPGGALRAYPDRAAIEAAGGEATVWLEDEVEVFLAQVQGSARVELPDGRQVRLAYDGRNGQPYTSIGRLLIDAGEIPEPEMSLARLKRWLRDNGLKAGETGRALMQRNRSYVFFKLEEAFDPALGPTGGAGVPLTPLRSIAIDRSIWPYGTPFFIDAELPWRSAPPTAFRRLMIAQDTGSAILGAARADIFFGGGEAAGARAGAIRHAGHFTVLLPRGDER